ncbi:hypothetical protein [Mycolicibacterium sp. P9-64]|uniref:hypothetical protein n=1 Tax=Mycolicibacterium sp. P9-64 TaxID=2024612 RepID=UPI0011F05967|nr:hypothetical protein [Mycolicibacterium sp. P9-64]
MSVAGTGPNTHEFRPGSDEYVPLFLMQHDLKEPVFTQESKSAFAAGAIASVAAAIAPAPMATVTNAVIRRSMVVG